MTESDNGRIRSGDLLERARAALLRVPFVISVRPDGRDVWIIRTQDAEHRVELTSNPRPTQGDVESLVIVERAGDASAAKWATDGVQYIDAAGNLHLNLGGRFHAHVEGRRASTKTRAMRAPAYRVLLAWLLNPTLLGQSLRATAAMADASRTAVQHMRARLEQWGYVVGNAERSVWSARGQREARRMWLEGYRTTLRPTLDMGRYQLVGPRGAGDARSVHALLEQLRSSERANHRSVPWTWAGSDALRYIPDMQDYFLGSVPQVRLHLDPEVKHACDVLPIAPKADGDIHLVKLPFRAAGTHPNLSTWPASVPHPLLVWSELSHEADPRAQEAAERLLQILPHHPA